MEKKLSEDLKFWRIERPDEWKMDEFIRKAVKLETIKNGIGKHIYSEIAKQYDPSTMSGEMHNLIRDICNIIDKYDFSR